MPSQSGSAQATAAIANKDYRRRLMTPLPIIDLESGDALYWDHCANPLEPANGDDFDMAGHLRFCLDRLEADPERPMAIRLPQACFADFDRCREARTALDAERQRRPSAVDQAFLILPETDSINSLMNMTQFALQWGAAGGFVILDRFATTSSSALYLQLLEPDFVCLSVREPGQELAAFERAIDLATIYKTQIVMTGIMCLLDVERHLLVGRHLQAGPYLSQWPNLPSTTNDERLAS